MSNIHSLKNPPSENMTTFMTEEELAALGLLDVVQTDGHCVFRSDTGKRHVWYVEKSTLSGHFDFHRIFKA